MRQINWDTTELKEEQNAPYLLVYNPFVLSYAPLENQTSKES